ncbi:MAG: valine--tRNA ligase [Candidatus Magasanikbacteria bacterium RIFOXYD2_FULL_36_9]|uniref:Valine--tRNA ligase n=1 Tax=Candidatus Magasanikbacteria bacterium RIFOXYD2_FULL_36_9 TaxID=1798707 RepID=A0A1F6P2A2_9BACT|nr:MAG: valine--tRNA ligase [Candidatus Magasanikbacteria bacterium RIFOXYD2_FULL_36_9]
MKELPKTYEPKKYEDSIYKRWEDSGFFNPDNLSGEPFSILFPPPNVTGVLHLGHALENSLMDTMVRYQRMKGKKALLLPGTDHAAVATQAKVEKDLIKQGHLHPREEYGREKLLDIIREFAESSKATILNQIKKMGTSCDWSRLAYTFDDKRSLAVNIVFKKMYDHGLIYRGYRVVNWSVKGQSTCSDDELVHIERVAKMYTFKYSKDFPLVISSTRPETKLGDTAVAVNPKDERYQKYIGQTFVVDVGAQKPLNIKIIADDGVELEFGTGALGVTPAHSAVDYEMYIKQKAQGTPIDLIPVIGIDGKMLAAAGDNYVGLTVIEARTKFVEWLKENDLLIKEDDIKHNVGTSDRFGDVVEALPLTQWFVDVNKIISSKNKSLKDLMKEAVTVGHNGDINHKIKITPERFEKVYLNWIDNLRDWCISRQIWWGHRVPVWYKGEEIYCDLKAPEGEGWSQDEDTLDTWFSSGLWTFSTLGWPDDLKDVNSYHPTSWMQMGYEIIFFWMARMILMTTYTVDIIPFKEVYIHGMLRDEHGKKFSKSANNGIDPLDAINEYGCDALRLSLLSGISPGNDSAFYKEKIEGSRNFVNKLWNISRYVFLQIEKADKNISKPQAKTLSDKWILSKLETVKAETEKLLDRSDFSLAVENLRTFTWTDFADWYVEIAKVEGDKQVILNYLLNTILKLWHPFIPFVTEQIWQEIYEDEMLMIAKWPKAEEVSEDISEFEIIKNIITGIRTLRADNKIEPAKKLDAIISAGEKIKLINENSIVIKTLARLEVLEIVGKAQKSKTATSFVEGGMEIFVELAGAIDLDKEKERLQKEFESLTKYINGIETKLANEEFVKNAPPIVIEKERQKLAEAQLKLDKIEIQL